MAAKVNAANTEGAPVLELADIPVRNIGGPQLDQPRIYYGEGGLGDTPFVITNSGTPELDYEGAPAGYDVRRHGRHRGRATCCSEPCSRGASAM